MENGDRSLLQLCYAAALVDAATNYELLGQTARIEEKKAREQKAVAAQQLARFGAKSPGDVLRRMGEVFGCTAWQMEEESEQVVRAASPSCLMCAIAKKTGAPSPCRLFCINPMKAFGEALAPPWTLSVAETLWEGTTCRFEFRKCGTLRSPSKELTP